MSLHKEYWHAFIFNDSNDKTATNFRNIK